MAFLRKYKYINLAWLSVLLLAVTFSVSANAAPAYPSPSANCSGERFVDVCPEDWFYPFVTGLSGLGVVSGYDDGTFRPNNDITRGQIMKIVVLSTGLAGTLPSTPTFTDVPSTHTFYQWIEVGVANGVVGGYNCGGPFEACDPQSRPYFRPGANVTRGQLSKMIVNAKGWTPLLPGVPTFEDVPVDNPFFGFVERVSANGIIGGYECGRPGEPCPGRYFRPSNDSTRAQASKIIWLAIGGPLPTPVQTVAPIVTPGQTAIMPIPTPVQTVLPDIHSTPAAPGIRD